MDRAAVERFIQLHRAVDQRLHNGLVGEKCRLAFRDGNGRAPRCSRPIQEGHITALGRFQRLARLAMKPLNDSLVADLQPTQRVVTRSQVKLAGTVAQGRCRRQVLCFQFVGILLDEGIRVLREAAGSRQQQAAMLRRFLQQALNQLEAERQCLADQLRSSSAANVFPPPASASASWLIAYWRTLQPASSPAAISQAASCIVQERVKPIVRIQVAPP